MAQTTINNGDSGAVVRSAINNNFTELYKGPVLLVASAAKVDLTGGTSETALATIAVSAGVMGLNGILRVTSHYSYPNSANNKTIRVRFGAAGTGTGATAVMTYVATTSTQFRGQWEIKNRNLANSQIITFGGSGGGWTTSTSAVTTSAINTAAATEIVLTGQLALGTETLSLESYLVELIVP